MIAPMVRPMAGTPILMNTTIGVVGMGNILTHDLAIRSTLTVTPETQSMATRG